MTKLIDECIDDEQGIKSLLYNYGLWCRYFGCKGYYSKSSHEESIIDDDSALVIDRAMNKLKQKNINMYSMLCLFYINGMDISSIKSNIKTHKNWSKTHFNEDFVACMKYCTYEIYKSFLERSESVLAELIKQENK